MSSLINKLSPFKVLDLIPMCCNASFRTLAFPKRMPEEGRLNLLE
jgi:hypothetical protein